MDLRKPVVIEAVMSEVERPALAAASALLAKCLHAASGVDWPVETRWRDLLPSIRLEDRPDALILSLLPYVMRERELFSETEARVRKDLSWMVEHAAGSVMICTVFRFVAGPEGRHMHSGLARVEQIRRLNRLAAQLSHDLGVGVIDIDRTFAHIGGRPLGSDYRLQTKLAADVGAYAIVSSLLAVGLDDRLEPELQERAKKFHGEMTDIVRMVGRHLASSGRIAGSHGRG